MSSITPYVNKLIELKNLMASHLNRKGVAASGDEKFNTLVPKVFDIQKRSDVLSGVWTTTTNTDVFYIENIPFNPTKIALSCEDLLTTQYSAADPTVFIALLNVREDGTENTAMQATNKGLATVGKVAANVSIDKVVSGGKTLYNVTVSLEEANSSGGIPCYFKSGVEYSWVIAADSWEV